MYCLGMVLLVSSIFLSGCSVVGLTVGATKYKTEEFSVGDDLTGIEDGEKVVAHLSYGKSAKGRYGRLGLEPIESYAQRYTEWRDQQLNKELPAFKDTFDVMLRGGHQFTAAFTGFDRKEGTMVIYLEDRPGNDHAYSFDSIRYLHNRLGSNCKKERLMVLAKRPGLPWRTSHALYNKRGRATSYTYFSDSEVVHITMRKRSYAAEGFLIGLGLDAVGVVLLNSLSNSLNFNFDFSIDWYGEEEE